MLKYFRRIFVIADEPMIHRRNEKKNGKRVGFYPQNSRTHTFPLEDVKVFHTPNVMNRGKNGLEGEICWIGRRDDLTIGKMKYWDVKSHV